MYKVMTGWTEATTDPNRAMLALISCVESGKNAWIEIRKNGEQEHPIMIKNPELDNPFNWIIAYGVPRNDKEMAEHKYFNDTEKDLTYNWVACCGEPEAVEEYQKSGTVSREMFSGMGVVHPVRIEDANYYREHILGDGYKYGFWVDYWKPKAGIPYRVAADIDKVFTICYTDEPADKAEIIRKAGEFLIEYANEV